jgi:hypothetical protein
VSTTYTYDGRQVTAAEMLRLVSADAEAQAQADADASVAAALDHPEEGTSASAEAQALSAQEYAVWCLTRHGFSEVMSNGRDPFDGMTLVAPAGGQIEIRPLDQVG